MGAMFMGLRVDLGQGWAELVGADARASSIALSDGFRSLCEQLDEIHSGLSKIVSGYSISPEEQAVLNRLIGGYQSPEFKEAMRFAFPPRPSFPAPALIISRPEPQGLIAPSVAELDAIQAGKPISARRGRNDNSWSYLPFIPRIESLLAKGLPHYTIAKAIVDRKNWAGTVNEAESRQVVYATSLDAAVDGLARFIKRKYFPSA